VFMDSFCECAWGSFMPVKPNTTKDKFGDDLMIKAETTPQGADDAAKIIAVCRGIRHILTPVAWIICTALVAYTTIYLNR
ncbi:TPA: hypothetical protein ACH99S_005122, partial [Escherichia coli]